MSEQFNPCEFCGARECVDNKCKLKNIAKKLKQENEESNKLKDEILNKKPSEREYCKGCTLPAYSKVLDEIKHILEVNKIELDECLFNDIHGQILQKIKEAKEK